VNASSSSQHLELQTKTTHNISFLSLLNHHYHHGPNPISNLIPYCPMSFPFFSTESRPFQTEPSIGRNITTMPVKQRLLLLPVTMSFTTYPHHNQQQLLLPPWIHPSPATNKQPRLLQSLPLSFMVVLTICSKKKIERQN